MHHSTLDLRLEEELPELEALPDMHSNGVISCASCIGSASCPVMTYGTAASLSSAG